MQDGPTAFDGVEPVVGAVRAVRTFRIGPQGELLPLFHDTPWATPVVTASCLLHDGDDHIAPDADCACGLYAYSGVAAARENPHSRRVLGVVSCWGRVIAGTRGLRAQHARIEALWISRRVPDEVVERVRTHHPWVTLFRDRSAMLTAFSPTPLDCYEPEREVTRRRLLGAGGLLVGGTVLWLAAPFGGTAGELLLRGGIGAVAISGAAYRATLRRHARRIPIATPGG